MGYYFLKSALKDSIYADSNYLFLNKITHLNIAFINPDTDGNFNEPLAIDILVKKGASKKGESAGIHWWRRFSRLLPQAT